MEPIVGGIAPVSGLTLSSSHSKEERRPNEEGISPVSWLSDNVNISSRDKEPISLGII